MFLLLPAHSGCPGQGPKSREMVAAAAAVVVVVVVVVSGVCHCLDTVGWTGGITSCLKVNPVSHAVYIDWQGQ